MTRTAEDSRNKYTGHNIIVLGGSGSVGQYVIRLARVAGFSNIITTASPKHTQHLLSLGATLVIDRYASPEVVAKEVSAATHGHGVRYAFDAVSTAETQQLGYDLLNADGEVAIFLSDEIKNKGKGKKIQSVEGVIGPGNHEPAAVFYENIGSLSHSGEVKPEATEVLSNGLAGIPDGLKRLEDNQFSGAKLVARPQE